MEKKRRIETECCLSLGEARPENRSEYANGIISALLSRRNERRVLHATASKRKRAEAGERERRKRERERKRGGCVTL